MLHKAIWTVLLPVNITCGRNLYQSNNDYVVSYYACIVSRLIAVLYHKLSGLFKVINRFHVKVHVHCM